MSVIITDRPDINWPHFLRWPVVGSVPDDWRRSRIRYTLECGHERSQAKARYLGRTSYCGDCRFIWNWLIGITKADVSRACPEENQAASTAPAAPRRRDA